MTAARLVVAGLRHYWRTNLAVIVGVATAVAVLAGALLVGDSVRGSLRDLVLQRLGRVDRMVVSSGFFREALAGRPPDGSGDFAASFADICPIVMVPGVVTDQATGRRSSRVQVYGVDDRFWQFQRQENRHRSGRPRRVHQHARSPPTSARPADGTIVVRVERPSTIPIESLQGRKDHFGRTLRLTVRAVLSAPELGDFSLRPQQGDVRAIFVPLRELQRELDQVSARQRVAGVAPARVAPSGPRSDSETTPCVRRHRPPPPRPPSAERHRRREPFRTSRSRSVPPSSTRPRQPTRSMASPVLTYLANALRSGDRRMPYSLVTAIDLKTIASVAHARLQMDPRRSSSTIGPRAISVLRVGDPLTLDYYVWEDPGFLRTRSARVRHRRHRADRRRRSRPGSGAGLSGDHLRRRHLATGIRRFRSISAGCGRPTKRTGSSTGRRRRPSSRSRTGSSSGVRVSAIGRRCASGRGRQVRWPPSAIASRRESSRGRSAGVRLRHPGRAVDRTRRVQRLDRFRRVLHLLQLLSRRLGGAAGGAVLQAQRRAARARSRPAAGGWLRAGPRPSVCSPAKVCCCGRRQCFSVSWARSATARR